MQFCSFIWRVLKRNIHENPACFDGIFTHEIYLHKSMTDPSMMIYLPTWMVDLYCKVVGKQTVRPMYPSWELHSGSLTWILGIPLEAEKHHLNQNHHFQVLSMLIFMGLRWHDSYLWKAWKMMFPDCSLVLGIMGKEPCWKVYLNSGTLRKLNLLRKRVVNSENQQIKTISSSTFLGKHESWTVQCWND